MPRKVESLAVPEKLSATETRAMGPTSAIWLRFGAEVGDGTNRVRECNRHLQRLVARGVVKGRVVLHGVVYDFTRTVVPGATPETVGLDTPVEELP